MKALSTTSFKCCLSSTDAIDKQEKITHAYEGSKSPHTKGYDPDTKSFHYFPYNENQTKALNTHSNADCHQITLLTGWKKSRMRMKVQSRFMQTRFIEIHQVFAKTKIRSDNFLKE